MAQIKALNKRLNAARTSAERESIRSLIAAAKADWFDRVSGVLADRQQAQQSEFFRQRAASSFI
jgi:hypothetical protein